MVICLFLGEDEGKLHRLRSFFPKSFVMATAQQTPFISEAEYLAGEKISDVKHEYIDGYVYAMSGAHANHNRISMNLSVAFARHTKIPHQALLLT